MTSKRQTNKRQTKRCFVYITLPGEVEPVTAARYEVSNSVGKLVYGRSYLAREQAVEIDPVELKLGTTVYQTAAMSGMFGALRDAAPDWWGRTLIERASGKTKLEDEIDYLLQSQDDRAGALGFGHNEIPPAPKRDFNKTLDLRRLQATALAILKDQKKISGAEAEQTRRLILLGTSMGGARPKAVVEDSKGLWIAKFNKPLDTWNFARVEDAMLKLARLCGISSAESRVARIGERDVLLVKRFDREKTKGGYLRARMVSALSLLRADDSAQSKSSWSYPALAEELRRVCINPKETAEELFRRMCFNALISNTDDHPRNHAIIAKAHSWQLSPAYDLTPSPKSGMERDLAMVVGDLDHRATAQNLVTQAGRFLLTKNEAAAILKNTAECVSSQWYSAARASKVTIRDCELIRNAFENEGFYFEAEEPAATAPH